MPVLSQGSPIADRDTLRRGRSFHACNFSTASAETMATCGRLRLLDALSDISCGLSIQRFEFGNSISFWLALSVKALDCCTRAKETHP
jgi:hypothetical protein